MACLRVTLVGCERPGRDFVRVVAHSSHLSRVVSHSPRYTRASTTAGQGETVMLTDGANAVPPGGS